jgi:AcrR family transcriptional regulator
MIISEKRHGEILDRLADHILDHGLIASSLRPLAKAAGTSDRMLLYYFADKNALIAAALETITVRTVMKLSMHAAPTPLPYDDLLRHFAQLIDDQDFWPYSRVFLEVASRAANGDMLYKTIGANLGRGFLAWGMAQLQSDNPDRDAARLLVTIEGMIYLKAIGLEDVCKAALKKA